MKKILHGALLVTLAGLCALASASPRPRLSILTEHSPPAAMLEGGQIVGYTTDKIREVMKRVGIDYEIEILPPKRAYLLAQSQADTCVFSVTRIPEREALFKWVGPTHESDWTLFGRADRDYRLSGIDDARKYRIGAYFGDVRGEALAAQGFNIDTVQDRLSNPRKLLVNRIDLWASSIQVGSALVAQNGWSGQIVPVLTFRRTELYLACNKGIPDALLAKMNAALRSMQAEGAAAAIDRKYNVVHPTPLH
jgi:polar amino acid transport system substrate-binding protein